MTENLVSGKKYRILVDAANDVWDRISFWTKASDVYYNDGTTAEDNKPIGILKRNTPYTIGSIAYEPTAPSWVMLYCVLAGTTNATLPTVYSNITTPGTYINDGTAKFAVYDIRPSSTLSSNECKIPSMSLINNLNSQLIANGKNFYFDYKDGKYGFNTSSDRKTSTFVPFGGNATEVINALYKGQISEENDTVYSLKCSVDASGGDIWASEVKSSGDLTRDFDLYQKNSSGKITKILNNIIIQQNGEAGGNVPASSPASAEYSVKFSLASDKGVSIASNVNTKGTYTYNLFGVGDLSSSNKITLSARGQCGAGLNGETLSYAVVSSSCSLIYTLQYVPVSTT